MAAMALWRIAIDVPTRGVHRARHAYHRFSIPAFADQLNVALGQQLVECSQTEFLRLVPLSGQTCADYLTAFIEDVGGYLNNPQGFEICEYCPARTTDEYLAARYNIHYSHRWRNVVIVLGASLLNVSRRNGWSTTQVR